MTHSTDNDFGLKIAKSNISSSFDWEMKGPDGWRDELMDGCLDEGNHLDPPTQSQQIF